MSRFVQILRYVAQQMAKSGNSNMTWSERENALMDLARWGECRLVRNEEVLGLADEKDFVTLFQPYGTNGVIYSFPTKGGGSCLMFSLDESTRDDLKKRYNLWKKDNEKSLAYFGHQARVEWYRIEILQSFL